MISVNEARRRVVSQLFQLPVEQVALAESLGRVLAQDAVSDLDMPPFDKSCMDGFAVLASDLDSGAGAFEILETIAAGSLPTVPVRSGAVSRIMTGAPVPEGADAVVMVEKTQLAEDGRVRIEDRPAAGQHIQPQAELFRTGDVLLRAGDLIRPQEMALLATIGVAQVPVHQQPRVYFISTGDELVPVEQTPGPGEIRDSNSYSLKGLVEAGGGLWAGACVVRDDTEALREAFREGLTHDILLISGGVSAGDFDLVEDVLDELGMKKHFDQVALKPGKPAVFGTLDRTLIYGLPGNPVSGFVVFLLFGIPAMRSLSGRSELDLPRLPARLIGPPQTRQIKREQYLPARLSTGAEGLEVDCTGWSGSSDMRAITRANCFLVLPAATPPPETGALVEVLIWHDLFS